MSVKLYELPRRDRSGFARGCRSLKFPSRARIVDMLNLVRALVCVLILVLSGTEQGQAQDARAPYPRIGTARSVPDGERHGVFDTKAQCESAKTHFESAATPRVRRLFGPGTIPWTVTNPGPDYKPQRWNPRCISSDHPRLAN